jgi:hypothetical protein
LLTAVNGIFYNMAEQIDIKLNIQGDSIKAFREELKKTKQELENTTDPKKAEKLSKSFEEGKSKLVDYNKQLRDTKKATDSAVKSNRDLDATFEEAYKGVKPLSSRLGELEDRMYEMALAGEANSDEFRMLQKEAVRMRKTIIEVDKQVDILADNQGFSVFGDGLADVGTSLMRLDFETASKQAGSLANAAGGISFGSAIKSMKQLGSTLLNLGKAILTNPLFLIAAIVTAIVVAIVKLMDELGFLTVIFEAIGDAIGWVIQQLKDFLDWIGLTSYAEDEAAERSVKASERKAAAFEEATNRMVAAMDHEIRMAELLGKDTTDLERKKVERLEDTNKVQLAALKKRYEHEKKRGELDYKEMEELAKSVRDKRAEYKQSIRDLEYFNAQQSKLRSENIVNGAMQAAEELEQMKEDRKARYEEYKSYRDARIDIEREIQDAEVSLIKNATERQQQELKYRYDRLIEDAKLNEELTQTERARLIELYGQQRVQAENDIQAKIAQVQIDADNKAKELKEQERNDFLSEMEAWQEEQFQLGLTEQQSEITAVEDKYFRLIELAKQHGEDTAELEEAQRAQIESINDRFDAERKAKEEAKVKESIALERSKQMSFIELGQNALSAISANLEQGGKAAKAIAVGQATIDTYRAAVAAFASTAANPISVAFPAAPYIAAASAVAMGVANVRNILSTDNTSSSVGGTPSIATGTPPAFGQSQTAESTPIMNLNEGIEQNAGGSKLREKVMVVDYTDIQNKGNELVQVENSFTLA